MTNWRQVLDDARLAWCRVWLALMALCSLPAFAEDSDARSLDQMFERGKLQIATPDARLHTFDIWVADDDERRARGLMFVKHLDEDAGMLFIYPRAMPISMWMKNTYVSLDMLFVRADGRIERIVENTKPLSLDTIESKAPVLAVIELAAGSAARLKIRSGAQVIHPAFPTR